MMLLAEHATRSKALSQRETVSFAPDTSFLDARKSGQQQMGVPESQEMLNKLEGHLEQSRRARFGGELTALPRLLPSPKMPPPSIELGARGNLGHLTAESGPAFELVCAKYLLGQGRVAIARELLQQALSRYPMDARLRNLYRAIAPGAVVRSKVKGRDRTLETTWLRVHREQYRGKWVALHGEQVLGVGDTLKEVLCLVQQLQLEAGPLIHHVD
jgi:Family of unknown function (DUF5678)